MCSRKYLKKIKKVNLIDYSSRCAVAKVNLIEIVFRFYEKIFPRTLKKLRKFCKYVNGKLIEKIKKNWQHQLNNMGFKVNCNKVLK